MTTFVISSGHGLYVRGAVGFLDEVNEARKVVDRVTELINQTKGHKAIKFHDNTSKNQGTNLGTIVRYHNSQKRDIDVSIHFNAGGGTGTEVLYYDQKDLAAKVSKAISTALILRDRGPKQRKELSFLNGTAKPAILLEVCFVDTEADAIAYKRYFDAVCRAIAESLTGVKLTNATPAPQPSIPSTGTTYTVKAGDTLYGIATTYKVTVEALKQANKLTTNTIKVGQKLTIPTTTTSTPAKPSEAGKRVEALVDVRYYNKPSWYDKDVAGTCKKGQGFTIVEKIYVGGADQYKVKNSKGDIYYITANTKYVKVI